MATHHAYSTTHTNAQTLQSHPPLLVSIDGNIGAGKSLVLQAVAERFAGRRVSTHPEPVAEWADNLAAYYADPHAHAFGLACRILLSFCTALEDAPPGCVMRVFERSPASSLQVFSALNKADGDLTAREWEVLSRMHADLAWDPHLVIFIDTPCHECCGRIVTRARPCEQAMTTTYIRRVEHYYSKFVSGTLPGKNVAVVRVDGSLPPEHVAQAVCDILEARLVGHVKNCLAT